MNGRNVASRLVLFDLDDTLCDYSTARRLRLRIALGTALEESGCATTDLDRLVAESIATHPHASDHFPALLQANGVTDPNRHQAARDWYHRNRFHGLALFPDALAVLRAVRAMPTVASVGLITNGPAEVQRDKITLLGLWDEVDFAIISGELGIEKPHPGIFQAALTMAGATPQTATHIGDSDEFDMLGAINAGLSTIWINPASRPWPHPSPAPTHTVATLTSILPTFA